MRLLTPSSLLALLLATTTCSALAHPKPTAVTHGKLHRRGNFIKDLQNSGSSPRVIEPDTNAIVEPTTTASSTPTTPPSDEEIVFSLFAAYETNMPSAWITSLAAGQTPAALVDVIEAMPTGTARALVDKEVKKLKEKAEHVMELKNANSQVDVTDLRQAAKTEITMKPAPSSGAAGLLAERGTIVAALGLVTVALLL